MAQPSVAAFFNTRKRHAADDILQSKNKVPIQTEEPANVLTTRSGRAVKRLGSTPQAIKRLSPKKKTENEITNSVTFAPKETTNTIKEKATSSDLKNLVKKELNFEEVKSKLSRSAKLQELKASLNRIQDIEKTRKEQEEKNRRLKEEPVVVKKDAVTLKEFKTIDLEILTSPAKIFKTPTKIQPATPGKNELMSPKRTDVTKRLLFSPSKDGSPSKLITPPAYQKFLSLSEKPSALSKLALPFKYRSLIEVFRCLDTVCAMFFKRKECITFKKLKPAVQRLLRKNLHEIHLAQVVAIFPEAYKFSQLKMRNYGSASKADYYQLVITPNVANLPNGKKMMVINEDDVLNHNENSAMNSLVMLERLQKFEKILLERVRVEHDKFLRSLTPPIIAPKEKVTRWHPEFDLESCPDITRGYIPQPPNVEKYSSAKDILSTARNLFNCSTPMERAMERLEAKQEEDKKIALEKPVTDTTATTTATTTTTITVKEDNPPVVEPPTIETVLKGVPKSLLEKIRQKQAAKALDAMTRRPSQDREATKYSRLPEMARHLRNVFISEKKGVLPLEIVLKKIENSFRTSLTMTQVEEHLRLIAKDCPEWAAFHEIRKTIYLKIVKDYDLKKVIEKLEKIANQKAK